MELNNIAKMKLSFCLVCLYFLCFVPGYLFSFL